MPQSPAEKSELMARIVVKAWTDPEFMRSLLHNARATLETEGLEIPREFEGEVVFLEDTNHRKHFVIPAPPSQLTISNKDLRTLAAQRLAIQLELF